MRLSSAGLWGHSDFLKLWFGETVSLFGSKITVLALPLAAVLSLEATTAQLGWLGVAQFSPFLLLSLLAGVWVDRRRRLPIMVIANLGRALLIGLIPLLSFLGWLRLEHLYAVAFCGGVLTVLFDLAYQSYLPSLVDRSQLVEGNAKLVASASVAEIGGPGVAGVLVELLTAPLALLVDALTYLVSVVSLLSIRKDEPAPANGAKPFHPGDEVGEGLRVVFRNPYLRAIAAEAATYNMLSQAIAVVFVVYATQELGIRPALYGLIIATGSVGALVGALLAAPAARQWGIGPAILGAMLAACAAPLLIPLARGAEWLVSGVFMLSMLTEGAGVAASNVHVVSLRQGITPDRLLGRMNASYRLLIYGAIPVGALLGGALGERVGLRPALLVCALGLLSAPLWVLFSPVPGLRRLPSVSAVEPGRLGG